ncbi:chromate transporter [Rhizobium sp. 9T]|uniref:chromate transporter n=1 Tax=Rhizobium croatiense TaxID=2867516 RepID=UPI001C932258|nr:chromate transporter [Rhizobium croatiense]MBY4606395.1 chromate transporter [Rhizobium croatiense]
MSTHNDALPVARPADGSPLEVFRVFLKLGLTSFGGPIAHLGYFRDELVVRRKWIDEAGYADLVALCQFLPGPASSQVGFSLGVLRGNGLVGGLAAWCAFTLPSALMLFAFALGAAAIVVFVGGSFGQIGAIALGAAAGLYFCRADAPALAGRLGFPVSRRAGAIALVLFAAFFLIPPLLANATGHQGIALFDAFYRTGALVFGGGHVVLPLLQAEVVAPGWVTNETFLAGYGLTQAVPGPLFTFAAYLGTVLTPAPNGWAGAVIALVAIFLSGLLLVYGMLPFWDGLRTRPAMQAAMRGTNAAVVGILGAALYSPVWTSAVLSPRDFALALTAFLLLTVWKAPPWIIVLLLAAASVSLAAPGA